MISKNNNPELPEKKPEHRTSGTDRQYLEANVRTRWLIGDKALEQLKNSTVAIFGLGGVGSYAAEALCRSGVGCLILFDHDKVAPSNLNRQLIATHDTLNQLKVEAARNRLLSINPECKIIVYDIFWPSDMTSADSYNYLPDTVDYMIDAIDTVSAKINLVCLAKERNLRIISCMGTGNKLDPGKLRLTDLFKTSTCPLARVMRRELKKRQIHNLKVVYSEEKPRKPIRCNNNASVNNESVYQKQGPASIAFVPGSAGLMLAAAVVNDLIADLLPDA